GAVLLLAAASGAWGVAVLEFCATATLVNRANIGMAAIEVNCFAEIRFFITFLFVVAFSFTPIARAVKSSCGKAFKNEWQSHGWRFRRNPGAKGRKLLKPAKKL